MCETFEWIKLFVVGLRKNGLQIPKLKQNILANHYEQHGSFSELCLQISIYEL